MSLPNTIRILVSSDNHVGYEERDPIRKDDSWRTFDEIMRLARARDVDMVLLGGDLFHDNKPSRRAMYQVMRSLRKNCLGDRPCELEFLSDPNTVFEGAFPYVNYEDPDINISIPVFSIHGNHDDPSGEGHLCSLDLLQCAGLVNYFGRINEADKIDAKPVLLQKGSTRLALYGLSNVRDERMFRTFRDGHVKWYRPSGGRNGGGANNDSNDSNNDRNNDGSPWFNLLAVHQNHHAHTATSYLPENVLPDWMDLVVWGHEHECLIDPKKNPETGFHVMQPGSSVATSLIPGEAVAKHVAVLSVTGREFRVEKIPLRTVRPMAIRDIVLARDDRFKKLATRQNNRQELTKRLMLVVDEMITEATAGWAALHGDRTDDNNDNDDNDDNDDNGDGAAPECPLPLVRLKVEYTPPEGGNFDIENPQRFSSRFAGRAANTSNIVHFYKKKTQAPRAGDAEVPEDLGRTAGEEIQVEELVRNFLSAQSLKLFPQAPFGDAVNTYVTKDDRQAMETFVKDSLSSQVKQMLTLDEDEDDLESAMEKYKAKVEAQFKAGGGDVATAAGASGVTRSVLKAKPTDWDSDMEGHWEDKPEAWDTAAANAVVGAGRQGRGRGRHEDEDVDMMELDAEEAAPSRRAPARRGTTRAAATKTSSSTIGRSAPVRGRGRSRGGRSAGRTATTAGFVISDDDDESEDQIQDSDDEPPATAKKPPPRTQPRRTAARSTQTMLNSPQAGGSSRGHKGQRAIEIEDDDVSDDPFEPVPVAATRTRRR